jgi:hypothetical protein
MVVLTSPQIEPAGSDDDDPTLHRGDCDRLDDDCVWNGDWHEVAEREAWPCEACLGGVIVTPQQSGGGERTYHTELCPAARRLSSYGLRERHEIVDDENWSRCGYCDGRDSDKLGSGWNVGQVLRRMYFTNAGRELRSVSGDEHQ